MEKLKLYNWYGEEFESKLPETADTLKAYKHQVNNVFTRLSENTKTRYNVEKDLFLRAKTKINDNLKRELDSNKVAYLNKLKVYKDSIKKLAFVDDVKKLINFELKKIRSTKKANKKYVKDFVYSLEHTGDDFEDKVANIQKLQKNVNSTETELFQKHCLFNAVLIYLKKFQDRDFDFDKLQPYLSAYEVQFLSSKYDPSAFLQDFYAKLEIKRAKLIKQKDLLVSKYNETKKLQRELYLNEKNNIILSANQRIVELENEFNLKTEELKTKAENYKKEALTKIKNHKAQILANEKANVAKIKQIKSEAQKVRSVLKVQKDKLLPIFEYKFLIKNANDFISFINKQTDSKVTLNDQHKNVTDLGTLKAIYNKTLNQLKELNHDSNPHYALYKIAFKYFFNCSNLLQVKKEAKALVKSEYLKNVSKTYRLYSYEAEFKQEESNALREWFIEARKTRIKFLKEKILAKFELQILKVNGMFKEEQEDAKVKFGEINKVYKKDLEELSEKVKNKEISKQAVKNKKIEIKIKAKEARYTVKLESKILKNREILKSLFFRRRAEVKVNRKIYESKINEAQKTIPVETHKNIKLIATILGFICPGLPEITYFRQYIKGILMLLFTAVVWGFAIPFSLGFYTSNMNGIFGFIDLGASGFNADLGHFPDARYFLFGGVVSVILLTFSIIYFAVSAIGASRVAKSLYQGSRASRWSHTKRWLQTSGFPWMISLFGWFLMIFIVVAPVVTSILISFTNFGFNHQAPTQTVDWVGLEQWGKWWIFRKANLIQSIGNVLGWTLIWTFASTILPICLGLLIAILANNKRLIGKKYFRLIFILPWAIPAFVTLGFMKNMFASGETGLVNFILLKLFNIEPRSWLQEIGTARVLVILVQTWIGYAWIFMLVTGNLQSIPKDIYEAGSVDGAKGKHLFWYLTLPSLLLAIAPMLIGQFVAAFNNFTTISIFTGGGPAYSYATTFGEASTDIIISWVYKLTTGAVKIDGNQAFGAALATLASLFSIGLAARGFIKSMSRRD
ncbi:ABC transporter permease subunit [Mycoplasmopsis glycophila]|uniref:Maltose transport system permease protein malF n=1 Tax=Mycoplasmopsis glycophila TaxID=171285 RepID=A0A449AWL9_9BACT|nr:ABC transporter permease subunit [Mycoplasmopsis glycophila]VEU71132.1 Maltose transport system permease protein malF [Mycoplasmopsis glycophila]